LGRLSSGCLDFLPDFRVVGGIFSRERKKTTKFDKMDWSWQKKLSHSWSVPHERKTKEKMQTRAWKLMWCFAARAHTQTARLWRSLLPSTGCRLCWPLLKFAYFYHDLSF
jgi:hypothetical protein